ncbi:MAG: hypothetical protein WD428_01965, partial [Gaiellaceae bacterium]
MNALELWVEALDLERPGWIAVEVGDVATLAAEELVGQQLEEALRPAAERVDPAWRPGGLGSDGDCRGARCLRNEEQRVAPRQAAQGPELVPHHEDEAWADASPAELLEEPPSGIGLVGEPDLDVLRVARDPRIWKAGRTR